MHLRILCDAIIMLRPD